MEYNLEQLVTTGIDLSLSSIDNLQNIIHLLKQPTDESLSLLISQSFQSLFTLQQCAWKLLSQDFESWIDQSNYLQFLDAMTIFNKNLIFNSNNICLETKMTLLLSATVDQIDHIFEQIEQNSDDNHPYINIINVWFCNLSHFMHEYPNCVLPSIFPHMNQYIKTNFIETKQFEIYLTQLRQKNNLSQSLFTAKFLFYLKTSLSFLFCYWGANSPIRSNSFDGNFSSIIDNYIEIIHIHSSTVSSWNKELLGCIAQIIGITIGCLWNNRSNPIFLKKIFPTEEILCNHLEELIRIIAYEPFYTQIRSIRSNDETILIDVIILYIKFTLMIHNSVIWFFRSNLMIQQTLKTVAETSLFDEICLCSYGILGTILTDEQLKQLKISDSMTIFFFNMLERAWHQPLKKYKHATIPHLLDGFYILSKNDSVQQKTVDLNKIPLFIEISNEYPSVYSILWTLSFNKDIQQQLRSNTDFMSTLSHQAKDCNNERMRKTLHGILWNLENHRQNYLLLNNNHQDLFDIMISYSHKDKELCKQIYDELVKSNYRVWIDFDQIHGNVMDAMAEAIECSRTVIICMSEEYRKSNYCRAEAQYAFQRQRTIVPVLLQKRYKPDGWLLFLIGQLLYIDFNKHEFHRAMEMLHKELKREEHLENHLSPVQTKEDILEWTETQTHEWLIQNKLHQMSRLFVDCDGCSLVYLSNYLRDGQTHQMLSLLQEDSIRRINENISLIELARFHSLIDRRRRCY